MLQNEWTFEYWNICSCPINSEICKQSKEQVTTWQWKFTVVTHSKFTFYSTTLYVNSAQFPYYIFLVFTKLMHCFNYFHNVSNFCNISILLSYYFQIPFYFCIISILIPTSILSIRLQCYCLCISIAKLPCRGKL